MEVALLVSPLCRTAYFAETMEVAQAELRLLLGEDVEFFRQEVPGLKAFSFHLDDAKLPVLARASFFQAAFLREGDWLKPLRVDSPLTFPDEWVYGAKYPGKTNELVTQLALNTAVHFADTGRDTKWLIDPLAGRGTTLLWASRYGLSARGIERNPDALSDFERHVKKQSKLHRIEQTCSKRSAAP